MSNVFRRLTQQSRLRHNSDHSSLQPGTLASVPISASDALLAEESDALNQNSDIPDLSHQMTQYPPDISYYVAPEARTVITPNEWLGKIGFLRPREMAWSAPLRRPQDVRGLILGSPWRAMSDRWVVYTTDSLAHDTKYGLGEIPAILVHFHWAFTGEKVFELEVVLSRQLDSDGVPLRGEIRSITYETDPKVRKTRDRDLEEDEVKQEIRFACASLMNVVVGFPMDGS